MVAAGAETDSMVLIRGYGSSMAVAVESTVTLHAFRPRVDVVLCALLAHGTHIPVPAVALANCLLQVGVHTSLVVHQVLPQGISIVVARVTAAMIPDGTRRAGGEVDVEGSTLITIKATVDRGTGLALLTCPLLTAGAQTTAIIRLARHCARAHRAVVGPARHTRFSGQVQPGFGNVRCVVVVTNSARVAVCPCVQGWAVIALVSAPEMAAGTITTGVVKVVSGTTTIEVFTLGIGPALLVADCVTAAVIPCVALPAHGVSMVPSSAGVTVHTLEVDGA